jgi:uncharacterized protein with von Willebrand factor type A (vWA) domain
MTERDDLVVHVARFAGALRARGVDVGVGDALDATMALTLIDLRDRHELRQAMRTALKIRPRDVETFDVLFDEYWLGRTAGQRQSPRLADQSVAGRGRGALSDRVQATDPARSTAPAGDTPSYSPERLLRRKPFDECSPAELAAMERLLARLAPRLATRTSRRLVPARKGGVVDLRRSFRRATATAGEFISLARRRRRIEEPRLVILCDTSGSMDAHARFLLAFALSLRRAVRRTEIFVFNTSLTRVTTWLSPGKMHHTLDRLASGVPDWSGGTRIGESLAEFVARHGHELVTRRTAVLILSDGLDRGDVARVGEAMRAIRSRARRVIWLNPLAGDPRYEPTARAMQAALPFIDAVAPAHNLESLERALLDVSG